jgi:tetratricopeptide (TPR) repeat protein
MSKVKTLLERIRQRSVLGTLVAYAAGSYVLVGGVDTLEGVLGLPSWVIPATALFCLAALPLVLATAWIERGVLHPAIEDKAPASGPLRWFNWRNLSVLLVGSFALLAAGTSGYMGMRVLGLGPWGTLIARGEVSDSVRVLVSDFEEVQGDPGIGVVVSRALEAGLASSPTIRIVRREELRETLQAMRLPEDAPRPEPVAREIAERSGIPVLVTGEVIQTGATLRMVATLVDPMTQAALLTLQEDAKSEDELLAAVDRLSGRIRERIGEPLKSVQNREPLPLVTTTSLEALKLYSAASEKPRRERIALLEEAVSLDPEFGLAWRSLAMSYGLESRESAEAYARAFEVAQRLPDLERLWVVGSYYLMSNVDYPRSADAYRSLLARYPAYQSAWVNLSQALFRMGDYQGSFEASNRAIELHVGPSSVVNLWEASMAVGDTTRAFEALDLAEEHEIGLHRLPEYRARIAYMAGDLARARSFFSDGLEWVQAHPDRTPAPAWWEAMYHFLPAFLEGIQGHEAAMREEFGIASRLVPSTGFPWPEYWRLQFLRWQEVAMAGADAREEMREALAAFEEKLASPEALVLEDGFWYALTGQIHRAREILDTWERQVAPSVRAAPRYRVAELELRGDIALAEGQLETALEHYRTAAEASTLSARPLGHLGWQYDRAGMPDSALATYRRYVEAPHLFSHLEQEAFFLPVAYERLGQLYEERGQLEDAARFYGLFVELWSDADPSLQPRVDAARGALVRIQGPGPEG